MAIDIRNITKSYGSKKVVDNVSITIPTGKITSFIGPNGAGKSTVLSIMSRLLNADSGEIYLNGELLNRKKSSDIAKQLAILKQTNNINLRLTIEDLVAFGRFPYCKGNLTQTDRTFIDNAIAYMNLDDIRHQYIDNLSGGQRQRAYIAMTLAQDTDYILLDEPLNNLDMKHSVQIMKILRNLVDEKGKTIIIVIHDINFVVSYSDYIVALKDGKMIRHGNTEEIMKNEVLKDIYGMEIPIYEIENRKFCLYY